MRIPSSEPLARRDDVGHKCATHGARLCEGQTFYDANGRLWALIEVPEDPGRVQALIDDLRAVTWKGLVNADEKSHGKHPPSSQGLTDQYEADGDSTDSAGAEDGSDAADSTDGGDDADAGDGSGAAS